MNSLNIGIIGYGVVGDAIEHAFDTNLVNKYIVDPNTATSVHTMYASFSPDVVFIAVPAPTKEDGSIDSTIIESVMRDLEQYSPVHRPIAVIKTTLTPDVIRKLEEIYPRIVYNPEFLTERNAKLDFIEADFLILGGRDRADLIAVEKIYAQWSKCSPCPVFHVDPEAAAMIKYTLNSFMATKVLFFNQINDIYTKSGTKTPWDTFSSIIASDTRMGKTHMSVPGHDGQRGFGGKCFPKDSNALIRYAKDVGAPFTALEEVVRANEKLRK